jgi:hypothetical protein
MVHSLDKRDSSEVSKTSNSKITKLPNVIRMIKNKKTEERRLHTSFYVRTVHRLETSQFRHENYPKAAVLQYETIS